MRRGGHGSPAADGTRGTGSRTCGGSTRKTVAAKLAGSNEPRWRNWQTHYLKVVAPTKRTSRFESSPGHSQGRRSGGLSLAQLEICSIVVATGLKGRLVAC